MTFLNRTTPFFALHLALAVFPAFASEAHNIVLLVPAALPPAAVDHETTPALARLRAEGVYFSNSHSGFPALTTDMLGSSGTPLDVVPLVASAAGRYSMALVDDTQAPELSSLLDTPLVEQDTALEVIAHETLPRFKAANRPFVLVYRFGGSAGEEDQQPHHVTIRTGGLDDPAVLDAAVTTNNALAAIESTLRELRLFDPDNGDARVDLTRGQRPLLGNGVIAVIPSEPVVSIEPRGDHGLIYLSPAAAPRANPSIHWKTLSFSIALVPAGVFPCQKIDYPLTAIQKYAGSNGSSES